MKMKHKKKDEVLKKEELELKENQQKQKINFHLMKSLMKKKKKMNTITKICLQIKI